MENAVDKIPANIAILDSEGDIVHVNESWERFGRENGLHRRVSWEEMNYLDVVGGDSSESASDAARGIERVLRGEIDQFELTYPCHSPEEKRWYEMQVIGFTDRGERYANTLHIDVTEQQERSQELDLFEALFTDELGYTLLFDATGEVVLGNDRLFDFLPTEPDEIIGKPYTEALADLPVSTTDESDLREMVRTVLDGEQPLQTNELTVEKPSGETIITAVSVSEYDIDQYTRGVILTVRDVTKVRQRRDQLRLFERAIEGSAEMLTAIGPDGTYLFANEAYRSFHDFPDESVPDSTIDAVLDDEDLETAREHLSRTLGGERIQYVQEREGPDGDVHPLRIRYYPLRDERGEIIAAVAAMRDLTERRQRERHLHVIDRVLRHNMHNDMNVIEGYANLIEEEAADEIASYGSKIASTADGLLKTVDKQREVIDLLSTAPERRDLDLVEITERVVATKEIEFPDATIRTELPGMVEIKTVSRIEKAIAELIENGIVHSRTAPTVTVRMTADLDTVSIRVADTGPGIPRDERDILDGNAEINPLSHGSGMGLWMVNWIVSRANGTLRFESNEPRGSTVVIRLPRF